MSRFSQLALIAVAAVFLAPALSRAQTKIAASSPFIPAEGGAVFAAPENSSTHELVGIFGSSKQTLVGITDKATRKSIWVPVGKSADGVEVISCDAKHDRAVVKIGGVVQTLNMRSSSPSGSGMSIPVVANTSGTVQSGMQAEQEREARMLVSDLLEIGIQQRKAYEQATKLAADQTSRKAPGGNALPVVK